MSANVSVQLDRQHEEDARQTEDAIARLRAEGWKPKHDDVFVRACGAVTSKGDVALVGHAKNIYDKGEIVEVGADVERRPDHFGFLKPGDFVLYAEEASLPTPWHGVRLARAESVVAIVEAETRIESYRGQGR